MAYNELYNEYNRLNNPTAQADELRQRLLLANPQLQSLLATLRGNLNQRGMGSISPMANAGMRATAGFTGDITSNYYQGLDSRKMGLLQLITQLQQAEEARKAQQKSALWGGLGGLLGMGLQFIPGLGRVNLGGGGYTPSFDPGNPSTSTYDSQTIDRWRP